MGLTKGYTNRMKGYTTVVNGAICAPLDILHEFTCMHTAWQRLTIETELLSASHASTKIGTVLPNRILHNTQGSLRAPPMKSVSYMTRSIKF
jgi:hypothetical protein